MLIITRLGCNLSPLLFSIFIDRLGDELNGKDYGLPLGNLLVGGIFFADDMILIGKNKKCLDQLMNIIRTYFFTHRLQLSEEKSKVMMYDASTGSTKFEGNHQMPSISLDNVATFKYLGIRLSTAPYRFFRCHNEHMKATANKYLQSVLSLVKSGPDRASLAYTLWVNCALPAILYGCEVIPVNQDTIDTIERCQARIGKFLLQIPSSSSNAAVHIDAGLRPVWSVIAEKVVTFASRLLDKPTEYWARIALVENIEMGSGSSYTKYLNKWKTGINGYGVETSVVRKNALHAAINSVLKLQLDTSKTTFAMNAPLHREAWFHPKRWVSDSAISRFLQNSGCVMQVLGIVGPQRMEDSSNFVLSV